MPPPPTLTASIYAVSRLTIGRAPDVHSKGLGEPMSEDLSTLLYTVEDAAKRLSLSRATCYRLIEKNALKSVSIGRSRRVPAWALHEFVRSLSAGAMSEVGAEMYPYMLSSGEV